MNRPLARKQIYHLSFLILAITIIAYLAIMWTDQALIAGIGATFLLLLFLSISFSKISLYFLFTYVIWGELLYSLGYLYLSKQYGLPAGVMLDVPLLIVLIVYVYRKGSEPWKFEFDLFDTLLAAFIFLIFCHLIYGIGRYPDVFNQTRGFFYYLLYFPFVYYFKDLKDTSRIEKLILWCSILFVSTAILDALGVFLPYQYKIKEHLFGVMQKWGLTLRFHTIIAAFGVCFFFLLLGIFRGSKGSKNSKLFVLLLICLMVVIIFYSMTRGYQIGFLCGLAFYLGLDIIVLKKIRLFRFIAFSSLFILLISMIIFFAIKFAPKQLEFVTETLSQRWNKNFIMREKSLGRRLEEISFFSRLFLEHPIIGHGIGKEELFFARDKLFYNTKRYLMIPGPHNEFFYFLYTMGIIGTGCYLAILFLFLKRSYKNLKSLLKQGNSPLYHLQASIIAVVFSFLVISNTEWRFRIAYDVVWISFFYALTRNISFKYRYESE